MRYFYLLLYIILISIAEDIKPEDKIIGMTTREFADSSRPNWLGTGPRPIRVVIWYPCEIKTTNKPVIDTIENKIVYHNGDIADSDSGYPLIVISPGSGQNAINMFWLGYYLSSKGYVTVSISHNGTAEEERQSGPLTLSDFCSWERPQDISVVLDKILSDAVFKDKVDTSRIGAAGFSLGGAIAIWSSGARLNMDTLKHNSPPPSPFLAEHINRYIELSKNDSIIQNSLKRSGNSFKDKRIKAVFALAPAIGFGFTKRGLSEVNVPVKIVVGDKDLVAPAETSAKRYAAFIKNSSLTIVPGERGHYLTKISEAERNSELEEVSKMAVEFFEETLEEN